MRLSEYRSKFTLFVCMSDLDVATEIRGNLLKAGYDCYAFSSYEVAKERFKEARPHLLIYDLELLNMGVTQLLADIREEAPELMIITVGALHHRESLSRYFEYGIYDHVTSGIGFESNLLWSVDRAVQSLIYIYQNEQLYDEARKREEVKLATDQNQFEASTIVDSEASNLYSQLIHAQSSLWRCKDAEELTEALLVHLEAGLGQQSRHLYFKYIPKAFSFIVEHFSSAWPSDSKGVGFRLKGKEAVSLNQIISDPGRLHSLFYLMRDAFGVDTYEAIAIKVDGKLAGILISVLPEHLSELQLQFHSTLIQTFERSLERLYQKQLLSDSESRDEATGLLTEYSYPTKLAEEIIRSQRLRLPVSVIRTSIDSFREVHAKLSQEDIEILFRDIAEIFNRTSRANDIVFRISDTEFAIILPHTPKKGGAIRAERLRRKVESTPFTSQTLNITISMGVAEYPSHALNVESLDNLARMAQQQVQMRGGNKVCLATPPPNFKPDFEVEV